MEYGNLSASLLFLGHEDVLSHLVDGHRLVLARRRIGSYKSCYEFIRSFCTSTIAKKYAHQNSLNRDKYIMLFSVTKSYLNDIPL